MGTSTRWEGPRGRAWTSARQRLVQWHPDRPGADERLDEIADDYLGALHGAVRADRSAFGLYEAAVAAGDRLAVQLESFAEESVPSEEDFAVLLARTVGGDGGTLTDAAVRRAAVAAGRDVLERHPELADGWGRSVDGGHGLASDILCDLYRLFFAGLVAEFVRAVVAEQVTLAVPLLVTADPDGRIAVWIARKVLAFVPDPCEEASAAVTDSDTGGATAEGAAEGAATAEVTEYSEPLLPSIARGLVPAAVKGVLGLAGGETEAPA